MTTVDQVLELSDIKGKAEGIASIGGRKLLVVLDRDDDDSSVAVVANRASPRSEVARAVGEA